MSVLNIVLIIAACALITGLLIYYFAFGRKAIKQQKEQDEFIQDAKETIDMLVIDKKKMPIKWSMITIIPVFIYGTIYLLNVQINGIGKWPKSNDFYGFLNWGLPIGIIIFSCIILMSWVIALLLRIPNVVSNRKNNFSLHREV